MKTKQVVDYFKTKTAAARALGVHKSTVTNWGTIVPKGRAYELEKLTDGALKVDPKLYEISPDTNSTAA